MGKIPGMARKYMGLYYDIFTRESPLEPPHVHIGRSPKHGPKSLKLNLETMKFMKGCTGRYTPDEMREALDVVYRTHDICWRHWVTLHGEPKRRTKKAKAKK